MTYTLDKPQYFTHSGLSWQQFKALQQAFEGSPGVRVNYFNGDVEILSVSPQHGIIAGNLGFLLELWMLEHDIDFIATEDMTVERDEVASAQGDKSYCFGERKAVPDLSIEVVIAGEGDTKLARYAALGVSEVWFWQGSKISIYQLEGARYQKVEGSQFVQALDVSLLATCVVIENRAAALAKFKEGH